MCIQILHEQSKPSISLCLHFLVHTSHPSSLLYPFLANSSAAREFRMTCQESPLKNVNPLLLSSPNTLLLSVKNTPAASQGLQQPDCTRGVIAAWRHNTEPLISLLHAAPRRIERERMSYNSKHVQYQERRKNTGMLREHWWDFLLLNCLSLRFTACHLSEETKMDVVLLMW